MRKMDSTSKIGAHAESQFISYALEQGWEVAQPFIKQSAYDMLIRRSSEVPWETIQVKRAYHIARTLKKKKIKNLEVKIRRGAGRMAYKDGDFDWLFVFHEEGRWFMPWDLVRSKRSSIQVGSSRYDLWKV